MHIRVLLLPLNSIWGREMNAPLRPPRSSRGPKCSQRVDFTLCQLSAKTVEPCLSDCAPSCAMATCICVCVCLLFSHQDKSSIINALLGEECTLNWNTYSLQHCHMHKSVSPGHMICCRGQRGRWGRKSVYQLHYGCGGLARSATVNEVPLHSMAGFPCGQEVVMWRVLTNVWGKSFSLCDSNFFVLHASHLSDRINSTENCLALKQNIGLQFWLPA